MTDKLPTNVTTEEVRFSYAHVWEPYSMQEGQEPKYSVVLLIPKTDTKTVDALNKAAENAAQNGVAAKWNGSRPGRLAMPLHDGDIDKPDNAEYAGCFFVNAKDTHAPGIVDANCQTIINQGDFYSGCYGRASVSFYAYSAAGNKGVACGLNNLQKLRDGDALSGRPSAAADFGTPTDYDPPATTAEGDTIPF
jgi:hypothetical protein